VSRSLQILFLLSDEEPLTPNEQVRLRNMTYLLSSQINNLRLLCDTLTAIVLALIGLGDDDGNGLPNCIDSALIDGGFDPDVMVMPPSTPGNGGEPGGPTGP